MMKKLLLPPVLLCALALAFSFSTIHVIAQKQDKKDKKEERVKGKTSGKEEEVSVKELEELVKQSQEKARKIIAGLKFQSGTVPIKDGLATIKLPENFRYLNPADARRVLVDLWENPPSEADTLGLIVPTGFDGGKDSWAVVITYREDGYVKDDDAEKINYNELLRQMKEGDKEDNAERAKQGYEPIELVGWAAQPHYDKASHKLYWARELKVGSYPEHTLNYDIRALGRRGVLSLNAIAGMNQLQAIEKDMQQVISFVEFNQSHRYGDYQASTDKVAAYGIGALIAGKVLAKAGLFKLLLGVLLAGKKFVIVAFLALGALLKKLFWKKAGDSNKEEPVSISETNG